MASKELLTQEGYQKIEDYYARENEAKKAAEVKNEKFTDKIKDKFEDIKSDFRVHPVKMWTITALLIAVVVLIILLIIFISLYAHEDFKLPWDEL